MSYNHQSDPFLRMIKFGFCAAASVFSICSIISSKDMGDKLYSDWTQQAKSIELLRDNGRIESARTVEQNLRDDMLRYEDSCWRYIDPSKMANLAHRLDENGV